MSGAAILLRCCRMVTLMLLNYSMEHLSRCPTLLPHEFVKIALRFQGFTAWVHNQPFDLQRPAQVIHGVHRGGQQSAEIALGTTGACSPPFRD